MSNNAPDYENLAFPPRHDETAYELQLKVNKLEKQLKIAVEALRWYNGLECILTDWELATGQKKGAAKQTLEQIKELDK